MFKALELYVELLELRKLGLTEDDISGYLTFFYEVCCEDIQ